MTREEVVDVLTKCAAFDQRTVGELDVMAWHEILGRVDLADALEAVRRHYTDSSDRAMPADILKLSRIARDERTRLETRAAPLALPGRFETDDIRDERLKRGIAQVVAALPPVDNSERIHQLAVRRARQEHGKPERVVTRKTGGKRKPGPPATTEIATLARRYLADGYEPADVAERFGIAKGWCSRTANELRTQPRPAQPDWCGQCAYDTRQRWRNGQMVDCPRCKPGGTS
jgi:hypothetical protein